MFLLTEEEVEYLRDANCALCIQELREDIGDEAECGTAHYSCKFSYNPPADLVNQAQLKKVVEELGVGFTACGHVYLDLNTWQTLREEAGL